VHLLDDVAPAHQLPLDVQLRVRRPVGVLLQPLADLLVPEDVKRGVLDAGLIEGVDHPAAEPAPRLLAVPLHEEQNRRGAEQRLDPALGGFVACQRLSELLRELPALVHLLDDVAPAHQLPLDVQLRVRRPVGVLLQPLADLLVPEDVKRGVLDAGLIEGVDHPAAEPAPRLLAVPLHEEQNRRGAEQRLDPRPDVLRALCGRGPPRKGGHPLHQRGRVGALERPHDSAVLVEDEARHRGDIVLLRDVLDLLRLDRCERHCGILAGELSNYSIHVL